MEHKDTDIDNEIQRLKDAIGVKTDTELGHFLGKTQGAISAAKARKRIPASWIKQIALNKNVDSHVLFFGTKQPEPSKDYATIVTDSPVSTILSTNDGSVETMNPFKEKLARIYQAINSNKPSILARTLGVKPPSIAAACKRQQIPGGWVETIAAKCGVSSDWLFFGVDSMRRGTRLQTTVPGQQNVPESPFDGGQCTQCAELKEELAEERRERREVTVENRQLWKENGTFRERIARMENLPAEYGEKGVSRDTVAARPASVVCSSERSNNEKPQV